MAKITKIWLLSLTIISFSDSLQAMQKNNQKTNTPASFFQMPTMFKSTQKNDKNIQTTNQSIFQYPKAIIKGYAQAYSLAFGTTFSHEFGHWLAHKILLKNKGLILINPLKILPFDGMLVPGIGASDIIKLCKFWNSDKKQLKALIENLTTRRMQLTKQPEVGIKFAVKSFAGPFFGFFTSLGILKGQSIYTEYQRNGKKLGAAFKYGLKQNLFNDDQSLVTQLISTIGMLVNTSNLIPLNISANTKELFPIRSSSHKEIVLQTDGLKIFKAFNIKPSNKVALSMVGCNVGFAGYLGYLLYKAYF